MTYTLALYSDVSNSKGGSKNDPVSYKGQVETLTPTAPDVVPRPAYSPCWRGAHRRRRDVAQGVRQRAERRRVERGVFSPDS